jgi:hypothetical protein
MEGQSLLNRAQRPFIVPTLLRPQSEDVPCRNYTDKREEMNLVLTKIGNEKWACSHLNEK